MKKTEDTKQTLSVSDAYVQTIMKRVEEAQATGDIPENFVYSHNNKTWLMTLPHSVMAQKRLIHARNTYLDNPNYDNEAAFLKLIAENTRCNGQPFNLDSLEYSELDVMKTAYMDGLLLPLSQGGDKALNDFMKAAIVNL